VSRMGSINVKGCLNRRVFCEPFHRNPSTQSIARAIPSQSIYTIHRNPSQSFTIHRNPSQSFAVPSQRQARRYRYQIGIRFSIKLGIRMGITGSFGIRFERSHEHTCSNRNRIGAFLIGSTALRRRLSVRSTGVGDALQTDTG
jgi:hypothetical protein